MKAFLFLTLSLVVAASLSAQTSGSTMMKAEGSSSDSSMMKAESVVVAGYELAGLGPNVVAFSDEKEAWALAKTKTVVYFFAAGWCPTCQATYRDLKANFSSLPGSLVLVFVDYDSAKDLKKKYGVTYQHTFVSIGPKGEKKKTWSGSSTLADIVRASGAM